MAPSLDDRMAPEASPDRAPLRTGVRRANKIPLLIVGGIVLVLGAVVAVVANDRAAQQQAMLKSQSAPPPSPKAAKGSTSFADKIVGGRQTGLIPAASTKSTKPEVPHDPAAAVSDQRLRFAGELSNTNLLIARPDDLDQPPKPGSQTLLAQLQPPQPATGRSEEIDPIKQAKLLQVQEALKAPTTVSFTLARSDRSAAGPATTAPEPAGSPTQDNPRTRLASAQVQLAHVARSDDPTKAYHAQLEDLRRTGMLGPDGSSDLARPVPSGTTSKGTLAGFETPTGGDRWRHDAMQEPPRAEFVIQAGDVLPALVMSEINSSQPGQIIAQVSQNVYDTPTKTRLLIPQGTKLIGTYSNDVGYGQSVLLVVWQRLGFPDGKTLDIGAMPGANGAGAAGLSDLVDNHYIRLFGSALLMSAITAGATYSQQQTQGAGVPGQVGIPQYNAGSAMSQALGQQLGQVTAQLIARNMNIAPELKIRPGYRFNVVATKDLTFPRPYAQFDY